MAGRLLIGDCRESLRTLPAKSVHCCVTSPPYWGLRDYGVDGQLGLEKSPAEYVAGMVSVFAEVWRVLRDDGVCWINIGDSYNGGKIGRTDCESLPRPSGGTYLVDCAQSRKPIDGLKPKDLVGIPWRLAFALQDAGWYLRQDCIWHKPNPMPESVRDRCTKAHEYVFLLTKSARYFFDGDAIKTKTSAKSLTVKTTPRKGTGLESTGEKINAWMEGNGGRYHPEESNRRSVWTIATHSYRGAHFATYPPKLVEPCILAGTSARGCCPTCGAPWRRVVESQRVATRPGTGSKVGGTPNWCHVAGEKRTEVLSERLSAEVVGNRDPQRHVSIKVTTGWEQTCKCEAHEPIPCTVLDPFMGSGTTAIVAEHHGREWVGCELSEAYAELARKRIAEGWHPKPEKRKRMKRAGRGMRQLLLMGE